MQSLMVVTALAIALVVGIACNGQSRTGTPTTATLCKSALLPLPRYQRQPHQERCRRCRQSACRSSVEALLEEVQTDSLMCTVYALAGMNTRHVSFRRDDLQTGIGTARDWLVTQLRQSARKAQNARFNAGESGRQPFTYDWHERSITAENVVAIFPGTQVGAGVIVVGAHYDSITQDWDNGEAYAPGASDNASGVAALLEIAQIMGKGNRQHHAT
ncbi:MAG: M28 family peptidase [Anaerolineae bacterium]